MTTHTLDPLLQVWRQLVSLWSQSGALSHAAQEALLLRGEPEQLQQLAQRWSVGAFQDLPSVILLPASAMGRAAGAYAISTGTIYLNANWLASASRDQALAVLTEELGHHLDRLLNASDTAGDEGELFAALVRKAALKPEEAERIKAENDHNTIAVAQNRISVEQSGPIVLSVNTTADQNDGSAAGGLSLRDAILIANADTTNDYIIELNSDQAYSLTNMDSWDSLSDNTGKTGDLDILPGGKVTIKGIGSANATIDGSGFGSGFGEGNRVFHFLANSNVSLEQLTITGSAVGGIRVEAKATANIRNSLVTRNVYIAQSGGRASARGGGIENYGTTTIQSSIISDNAADWGGGIYSEGALSISDSVINGNRSSLSGNGGGIYSSGSLSATNCVINANQVGSSNSELDGGFYNTGTATIFGTTFNNNSSTGIFNNGSVTLTGGSITNNLDHGLLNKGVSVIVGTTINDNKRNGVKNNSKVTIKQAFLNQNAQSGLYSSPDLDSRTAEGALVENTTIDRNGETGIVNAGTLSLLKSVVSNNGDGGLVNWTGSIATATAIVNETVIQKNITSGNGGGIDNRKADLTVVNSRIDGNSAAKFGGGIFNENDTLHDTRIVNSTISNNTAQFGGGILNSGYTMPGGRLSPPRDTRASLTAINLTISSNSASRSGGGVYNEARGDINFINATVSNNTSTIDLANTSRGAGGGIYNEIDGGLDGKARGVVNLKNTIIAGNFDTPNNSVNNRTLNPDLSGPVNGGNSNLIGNLNGASGSIGKGSDIVSGSFKLGPLQNNGGITPTHTLPSNSPAINKGNNTAVPLDSLDLDGDGNLAEKIPFDQRGKSFNRIVGGVVDIGAFEVQEPIPAQLPSITLTVSPVSVAENGSTNLIFTFSRTGATTSSLKVNYTVAGTATRGVDYTGIAATPATKSITFAANSSTATATVDPTPDTTPESNETVALTLATGSGYTIGTTSAVVSTINNDDFIGTASNNDLIGTIAADYIDGLAGADTLTGNAGADRFAFRFSHSSLTAPDRITDFAFDSDKITLVSSTGSTLRFPTAFSRAADNPSVTTLLQLATTVFTDANGALGNNQPLAANAAVLVRATNPAIAGTYLLINDNTAALNSSNDLLINLTGHSGTLPSLGTIAPNLLFV
jgi:hypothetical protein